MYIILEFQNRCTGFGWNYFLHKIIEPYQF
jgi:hypothetical protein